LFNLFADPVRKSYLSILIPLDLLFTNWYHFPTSWMSANL
jgi:hypothetical protein